MKHKTILFIGTGQIGKAILNKLVTENPKTVIIHNLTENESVAICDKYKKLYPSTKFIPSFGNVFMPYKLKDLNNNNLYSKSDEIIDYFYQEIEQPTLEKSTIVTLIKKHRPTLIVDAINTATVLGNAYNPENNLRRLTNEPDECAKKLMVDDCITKLINFVYSLKYGIETYGVEKYVKVSTTGLGGMGLNMPYTHGDNPKINLSSALMGKIAASGILHQLLWNLEHTMGNNVSLVIPGTFVGYDSVKKEPIETDKGLLFKRRAPRPYKLKNGREIEYNDAVTKEYLEFPVVRAGENHVYSKDELDTLTAIGQMEGITKEEVADRAIDCIRGRSSNDIFVALDNAMLKPTYLGREMIYDIDRQFKENDYKYGLATGNLGITTSKKIYELSIIKNSYPTISELKKSKTKDIVKAVNANLDKELIEEIITLGIPILDNDGNFYIGDYALVPGKNEEKKISRNNVEKWTKVGWVDLREKNIATLVKNLIDVYDDAEKRRKSSNDAHLDVKRITDDFDVAQYLAYYNNLAKKGRKG